MPRPAFDQPRQPAGLGQTARPSARREVLAVPLHDELILHDERNGHTYVLNGTGAQAWKLCDGAHSMATIVQTIARQYRIEEENARTDLQELIDGLECADLIEHP
jgi:Coenzyme PQQ synthesis protein D (PqqD)